MQDPLYLMGVKFNRLGSEGLLKAITEVVSSKGQMVLGYTNPEVVMRAQRDADYRALVNSASVNIPDGTGIILASRLLGSLQVPRVQGSDFIWDLMERGARLGWRIYLFGGAPGVAQRAAERFQSRCPDARIVGTEHGYLCEVDHANLVQRINRSGADILLVCLGMGRQEAWAQRWKNELDVRVLFCNGGALDFAAGLTPRAPKVLRRLGLEWAFRLARAPHRWRRQLALPRYALAVITAWLGGRREQALSTTATDGPPPTPGTSRG